MSSNRIRDILSLVALFGLLIGLVVLAVLLVKGWKTSEPSIQRPLIWGDNSTAMESTDVDENFGLEEKVKVTTTARQVTEEDFRDYRIKLNFGEENSSGHVYIQYGDQLGFVCSDGFGQHEAEVVCRELGYSKGLKYDSLRHTHYNRYTDYEPILSGLNCTGNENRLHECEGFDTTKNVTSCTWFAAVVCYNGDRPYELRLINNNGQDSGLVEMKLGGVWGVVCAIRTFDDELADILCRNMNYTGGITMKRGISGALTQKNVWVPYISCDVGEPVKKNIFECTLILHTENILKDKIDFRNNRYVNEYRACLDTPNSFAAAVQCLDLR